MKPPLNEPRIAIVIVNWNKKEYILNLLESLNNIDYQHSDIVVVDNASTDGSVQAIKEQFPNIQLLVNEDNLGGTGGFNTGMRYALSKDIYKYIWLLDNDVEVQSNTLSELVSVMDEDEGIGIAGSMCINPETKDLVDNAGINIDWNSGILKALFGNNRLSEISQGVFEVDCVSACSALARVETLEKTGLMDERYFLWWDDVDLSLSIRNREKKAVSVSTSVVYHPAEKDRALMNYYNYRNSLLTYSKYAGNYVRLKIFHRIASSLSKLILFYYLTNNRYLSTILYLSLRDFLLNRWGKLSEKGLENTNDLESFETGDIKHQNNIVILHSANFERISNCIELIRKQSPSAHILLVIQNHRKNLFANYNVDDYVVYDERSRFNIIEQIRVFWQLLFDNYDIAIMPSDYSDSPFGYAAKKYFVYSEGKGMLRLKGTRKDLWKVILATVLGEIIALPLTAVLLIKSYQYRRDKSNPTRSG